jgi:hypothetical protein
MKRQVNPIPDGHPAVSPYLIVKGAASARAHIKERG